MILQDSVGGSGQGTFLKASTQKMTQPPTCRKGRLLDLVAFKVEQDVAAILNEMPNKSAFIRDAIRAALGQKCPLCAGSGVLTGQRVEEFRLLLDGLPSVPCRACGESFPVLPITEELLTGLADADAQRLLQYRRGGPFYCHVCFAKTEFCSHCRWYVLPDVSGSHGPACAVNEVRSTK